MTSNVMTPTTNMRGGRLVTYQQVPYNRLRWRIHNITKLPRWFPRIAQTVCRRIENDILGY